MGAVYRATDTKLNRDVAIKVLPESFAADAARMQRFEREAQVLASLNHPNIAGIYGVEEGAIVMELVEGTTLMKTVERRCVLSIRRGAALRCCWTLRQDCFCRFAGCSASARGTRERTTPGRSVRTILRRRSYEDKLSSDDWFLKCPGAIPGAAEALS
jgi:hypothetical protein